VRRTQLESRVRRAVNRVGVRRAFRLISGLALLAVGLLLGWGYWNAVQPPVVVRAALPVPGLSRPVTVALLSDTHRGWPDMPATRLAAVVDQVNGLGAEAILLAGDYAGGKPFEWERTFLSDSVGPFRRLRAPLGVFMVGRQPRQPEVAGVEGGADGASAAAGE
jgi:predicted MPP superfamily phosphohydrolase